MVWTSRKLWHVNLWKVSARLLRSILPKMWTSPNVLALAVTSFPHFRSGFADWSFQMAETDFEATFVRFKQTLFVRFSTGIVRPSTATEWILAQLSSFRALTLCRSVRMTWSMPFSFCLTKIAEILKSIFKNMKLSQHVTTLSQSKFPTWHVNSAPSLFLLQRLVAKTWLDPPTTVASRSCWWQQKLCSARVQYWIQQAAINCLHCFLLGYCMSPFTPEHYITLPHEQTFHLSPAWFSRISDNPMSLAIHWHPILAKTPKHGDSWPQFFHRCNMFHI